MSASFILLETRLRKLECFTGMPLHLAIHQHKMYYFSSPPNKWLKTTLDYQLIRKVCFSSRCWLGDLTEVEEFKMDSHLSGASTVMAGTAGLARDFSLPPMYSPAMKLSLSI